jgi:tripartite-type tricarboxylate transporter receptor subunit TctC
MKRKFETSRLIQATPKRIFVILTVTCILMCFLCVGLLFPRETVFAKDYPEKNITYIIAFAVGGKGDLLARAIVPYVQERLGVSMLIENYPGVVRIGLTRLWKSKPDGYTIGSFSLPSPVVAELTTNAEYRSKEFTHLYAFNASNMILLGHPSGAKDMAELVRSGKSKSLAGSTGSFGSGTHLASLVMAKGLGIDVRWVHYNSGGEASAALAGGHVDFCTVSVSPQVVSLVKAGKLKPLMIVGDEKDTAFPETPTPKELGYSFKNFPLMEGVAAPKGLPPDRLSRLEKAFDDAAKDPRFKKWADETKTEIVHFSSEAFRQKVAETYSEVDKFKGELKSQK